MIIPRASDVNEFIVCFFLFFLQRTRKNVLTSVSTTNCQVCQFVCVCVSVCSNILTVHKQHCVYMCVSWLKVCVCVDTYGSIFQKEALSSEDVSFFFCRRGHDELMLSF